MSKTENKIKLTVENLGKIEHAELEVGDLTIIAGENSSGKSYIVYSLWQALRQERNITDFLENMQDNVQIKLQKQGWNDLDSDVYSAFKSIFENNNYTLDLGEAGIRTLIETVIETVIDEQVELQPDDLQQLFKDQNITGLVTLSAGVKKTEIINKRIKIHKENDYKINIKELTMGLNIFSKENLSDPFSLTTLLVGVQSAASNELFHELIKYLEETDEDEKKLKRHSFLSSLSSTLILSEAVSVVNKDNKNKVSLISSERAGAFLFWHDEADKADKFKEKAQLNSISAMKKVTDKKQANTVFNNFTQVQNSNYSSYTAPVAENIKFARDLAIYTSNKDSYIKKKYPQIITELEILMGGKLFHSASYGLRFTPFKPNSTTVETESNQNALPFHLLSSSIRSLSYIYFYVKHELEPGEILIIDEPEAYLHPSNQMRMARILAMLVNAGVRVVITTHSDYMVREFNALIALGSMSILPTTKQKKSYSVLHSIDNSMLLNYNDKAINIYGLNDGYLTQKFVVNQHGLNLNTFDIAMNNQSKLFSVVDRFVSADIQNKG